MKDPANGVRQAATCPSFGGVVSMFLSERYSHIVDDYRVMLEQDPKYLAYHHTSAALQLQFQLKLEDFPALCIGECIDERSGECCIVSALREAIRQRP